MGTNSDIDELTILADCQNGNLADFEKLYDKYLQPVYRFIYYKTFHKQTTEDLTSQTFLKAINSIESYDAEKASFKTWIFTIARNSVIDHYRTKKETSDLNDVWDMETGEDIERDVENQHQLEEVKKYLKNLPGEHRELIILRVWNQLSYKEISSITQKSEASCKMMFTRAMNRLREDFVDKLVALLFLIANSIRHG